MTEAEDGPIALQTIEVARQNSRPFDLILLDDRMPEMDGFEVAIRLKQAGRDELTIMMLSSCDLKVELARVREVGLDVYLVKPIRRTDLFEAIAKVTATGQEASANSKLLSPSRQPTSLQR